MKKLFAILLAVLLGTLSVVTAASGDGAGAVKAGDTVTFGVFPQEENGKDQTPIDWIVLDVQDGKALLISEYGLDARPCVKISDYRNLKDVTWEDCELRSWLNETFLSAAFSEKEQAAILETEVDNSSAQGFSEWPTVGGNNTKDRIFLLSYAEANRYFGVTPDSSDNVAARTSPTAYAFKTGEQFTKTDTEKTSEGKSAVDWWLRSPGKEQINGALVTDKGTLSGLATANYPGCYVRPVMWVSLDSGIFGSGQPQPAPEPQPDSGAFTFRSNITWGMPLAEITAIEGEKTRELSERGYYFLYYDPVAVSKVSDAILAYLFTTDPDALVAAWYAVRKAPQETIDYFIKAYNLKYGEEKEADTSEFMKFYSVIQGEEVSESFFKANSFHRWDAPGGTQIWMAVRSSDSLLMIMYFSPDMINPAEKKDVDLTGI